MASALNLNRLSYLLVSGASKGIGKSLAIQCSKKLTKNARVVITARNTENLEQTKNEILQVNPSINVVPCPMDLGTCTYNDLQHLVSNSLPPEGIRIFEQAIIIHNVGTTGDVSKKARECSDLNAWHENFRLNVFNVALLNNVFLDTFKEVKRYVYNISAKAAYVPYESFGIYGPNKAARHMYFKVLAEEEKKDKNLIVFQYYPGPVDTDLVKNVEANSCSPMLRTFFKQSKAKSTILTPDQTVLKFLEIVEKGGFKSGDFIDYHDHKYDVNKI